MPADLTALVESSRVSQEVADRLGAVEVRVGGMEAAMSEQTAILGEVKSVLVRMDLREEEERTWRRERERKVWGLLGQPVAIVLAAAAAFAAARFGIVLPAGAGSAAPAAVVGTAGP